MSLSEARKQANKKWNDAHLKEKYDRIQLVVQKGQKEVIQAAAQAANESVNAYIYAAIVQRMEREQTAAVGVDFHIAPERTEDISE